jgi:cytochrome b6-f complex iron-sulfur subunit
MNEVSRGQFLKQLGLGTKALMAYYCLGAVSACSSEEEEPTPVNNGTGNTSGTGTSTETGIKGTTTGSSIDFTIDLGSTNYTKLKTEGEFVFVESIIVVNAKGKYVALAKTCTHAGTQLTYRKTENDLWCSNHGSEFGTDGSIEKSPATKTLTVYKTELSTDGKSLNIKA